MANVSSSYIATVGSTVTRAAEQLQFPFTAKPQAMTVYVKFIERGSVLIATSRIWAITNSAGAAPTVLVTESGGFYSVSHNNGTVGVSSTLGAAPVIGDTVEVRAVLFSDGAVQLHQSINAAAETSATKSAANALAAAWADQTIFINSGGTGQVGFNAFISVKIVTGEQSMTTMRQLRTAMGAGP